MLSQYKHKDLSLILLSLVKKKRQEHSCNAIAGEEKKKDSWSLLDSHFSQISEHQAKREPCLKK